MERNPEHLLQSIQRLRIPARQALEILTRYYLGQLAKEHFHAAPDDLAAALSEIRRALTCRGLVAELSEDDQAHVLEVLGDHLPTPLLDEEPRSRTNHIDTLLQEVSIGLICWHARTTATFVLFEGDRLPACERFRHGDSVVVRAADWTSYPYNGRTGVFQRYNDPRIGHQDRWAVVHLDGQADDVVFLLRPAHLKFVPEEAELARFQPVCDYQIERETWSEMQDVGRYHRACVLKYRITEQGKCHRVTLSAGRDDDLDVFTDGGAVYVLSANDRLGDVGVQVFADEDELESFFFQEGRVEEELGADFWDLASAERLERIVGGYQPREFDLYEHFGTWSRGGFTLEFYDTGRVDRLGKSILAYELLDKHYGQEPVFQGADFHCSPLQDRASDAAVADLLGFLSARLGDTDSKRLGDYLDKKRGWGEKPSVDLAWVAEQFEQRQRWRDLHRAGDTEEAVLAIARYGQVEDVFEVLELDIFDAYDLVEELGRRRDDSDLNRLLRELHHLRNVELVGGEEELARWHGYE